MMPRAPFVLNSERMSNFLIFSVVADCRWVQADDVGIHPWRVPIASVWRRRVACDTHRSQMGSSSPSTAAARRYGTLLPQVA